MIVILSTCKPQQHALQSRSGGTESPEQRISYMCRNMFNLLFIDFTWWVNGTVDTMVSRIAPIVPLLILVGHFGQVPDTIIYHSVGLLKLRTYLLMQLVTILLEILFIIILFVIHLIQVRIEDSLQRSLQAHTEGIIVTFNVSSSYLNRALRLYDCQLGMTVMVLTFYF